MTYPKITGNMSKWIILKAYIEPEGDPEGRGTSGGGVMLLLKTKLPRAILILNMGSYRKLLSLKPWTSYDARFLFFTNGAWEVGLNVEDVECRHGSLVFDEVAINLETHNDISWLSSFFFLCLDKIVWSWTLNIFQSS